MDPALRALKSQKALIEAEIASLKAKLARVVAAIDALTASDLFDEGGDVFARPSREAGTLKQMAFTVLHDAEAGLTAQQILEAIEQRFGRRIERTSMSPQLSRLGQDGILIRRGNLWLLNPARDPEVDGVFLLSSRGGLI